MLSRPFFRRLFLPYLLLICLAVGAVGVVGAQRLHRSYMEQTRSALNDEARLLEQLLKANLTPDRSVELNQLVVQLGQTISRRITVVGEDGTVIADNEADPTTMENHLSRPEILTAASLGQGADIRDSNTVHDGMMYFVRRVDGTDGGQYFLRVSVHLRDLQPHLRAFYMGIGISVALAILGSAALCYLFARRTARPVVELISFADALRHGDLTRRTMRRDKGEIGQLAAALDSMADSLNRLITRTRQDRAQILAILSSMSEGVIATDTSQRILLSNEAAARLLGFSPVTSPAGRLLWETVRSQPILQATGEVLSSGKRRRLRVGPIEGRHLDVIISTFPPEGQHEGLVLVMHDSTEAVRYEDLRKEFVANVSHELRTPLSAIKGYAETLRDGAINDPDRAPRYLATIEKHVDQLTNLVDDLLNLSRLESLPGMPEMVQMDIGVVLQKAVEMLRPAAARKQQNIACHIAPSLPLARGSPEYMERAIANLLDNAIKYTPEGGSITASAREEHDHVIVEVTDTGIGIPAADLSRVFERFYRVDRSRSREMGGTGLGLSIVKHIAHVHHGSVSVTSQVGTGSTFQIKLPAMR